MKWTLLLKEPDFIVKKREWVSFASFGGHKKTNVSSLFAKITFLFIWVFVFENWMEKLIHYKKKKDMSYFFKVLVSVEESSLYVTRKTKKNLYLYFFFLILTSHYVGVLNKSTGKIQICDADLFYLNPHFPRKNKIFFLPFKIASNVNWNAIIYLKIIWGLAEKFISWPRYSCECY